MAASKAEAREQGQDDCAYGSGFGDGEGERLDAVEGDTERKAVRSRRRR